MIIYLVRLNVYINIHSEGFVACQSHLYLRKRIPSLYFNYLGKITRVPVMIEPMPAMDSISAGPILVNPADCFLGL